MSVRFSSTRLKLLGSGSALPGASVENDELLAALEAHCGPRIARRARRYVNRLGIRSRHLSRDLNKSVSGARDGMDAPTLCRLALEQAGPSQEYAFLIGHTSTPHTLLPPNIAWVAESMRYSGQYLELRQACTGFANALTVAAAMIVEDPSSKIAIVGSENGSPYFDISATFAVKEQLINYVQMGDGAGAVAVGVDDGGRSAVLSDIFVGQVGTDLRPGISIEGGGSGQPVCSASLPVFRHNATDVRKNGARLIELGVDAVESRGYALRDFDWIIPHQANGHIAAMFAARYPHTQSKVVVSADRLGNLGSAAIWVSFDQLLRSGRLERGQRVVVLGAEASKYLYGGFVYTH